MIKKGWGIDRNMEVHEMPDNNALLFQFTSQFDYIKILKGHPWSILGALLNLQHWDDFIVIQEVDFGWCPFWIQFHGLPHNTLDDDNAITLGNAVGRVMMYESPQDGGKLSRTFIRTRSLVNIHEPLVPGFWVPRPQREPIWVTIKYEMLQIYCYDCGRIGHEAKNCKFPVAGLDDEDAADNRVGPGLGTPYVKTKDHLLVVHDSQWNEFPPEPPQAAAPPAAASGTPTACRLYGETSRKGKNIDSGENSAIHLWRYPDIEAGTNH
ncbi:hypothetical protein K1719_006492 [Acacia pycnantha]|nr:hypothetical protein K1719_006492 [Acacia pycnantha]